MPSDKDQRIIAFYGKIPLSTQSSQRDHNLKADYRSQYSDVVDSPLVPFGGDGSSQVPHGSIAYHPVFGDIMYRANWHFSTEKFIQDLLAADENQNIIAHIIHVDSCGGEAYGCHDAFGVVRGLKKPCYGLIDTVAASAGYYLVAGADKVFASNMYSEVGCIGVMAEFLNMDKYFEQEGVNIYDYYSHLSPLKNKVFDDARRGEGEEYITKWLDPLARTFIDDVKSARPDLSEPASQGETYYAINSLSEGLIDGQNSLEEIVALIQNSAKKPIPTPSIDINQILF
ncbi:MAG: S49 family peptidase [Candidatus Cryptobacteroides sp.]